MIDRKLIYFNEDTFEKFSGLYHLVHFTQNMFVCLG